MPETGLARLLASAARDDQVAWAVLVRGLSAVLTHRARRCLPVEADAADVCQEVWLTLARRLGTLRDPDRLRGWLVTAVRRRALRIARELSAEPVELPELPVPARAQPEAMVLAAERNRAFWRAVAGLPPRHRKLMWLLAEWPERPYAELAAELGIAEGSVGPLRARCFARVRRRLRAEGYDASDIP